MAAGWWAREALSAGLAMTREGLDGYLQAHREVPANNPPETLPSEYGQTITLYAWTCADEQATDWRLP